MASQLIPHKIPEATKNSADGHALIRLIEDHSQNVRSHTVTCTTTICRHCGFHAAGDPDHPFTLHGNRPRHFLVLVGLYVRKVIGLLARWRCPHCRRTFTDYPWFACPYKAYTLPQMAERAAKYVNDTAASYRKGVCSANLPVFHAAGPVAISTHRQQSEPEPSLTTMAHTSLFRWVTTLGTGALQGPHALTARFAPAACKQVRCGTAYSVSRASGAHRR